MRSYWLQFLKNAEVKKKEKTPEKQILLSSIGKNLSCIPGYLICKQFCTYMYIFIGVDVVF